MGVYKPIYLILMNNLWNSQFVTSLTFRWWLFVVPPIWRPWGVERPQCCTMLRPGLWLTCGRPQSALPQPSPTGTPHRRSTSQLTSCWGTPGSLSMLPHTFRYWLVHILVRCVTSLEKNKKWTNNNNFKECWMERDRWHVGTLLYEYAKIR